jgi:hypothetical protein
MKILYKKKNILPTLDYLKVTWKSLVQNNEIDNLTAENLNGNFSTYVTSSTMKRDGNEFHRGPHPEVLRAVYINIFIRYFPTTVYSWTKFPKYRTFCPKKKGSMFK